MKRLHEPREPLSEIFSHQLARLRGGSARSPALRSLCRLNFNNGAQSVKDEARSGAEKAALLLSASLVEQSKHVSPSSAVF